MSSHFRGPLLTHRPNHPFHGIPLDILARIGYDGVSGYQVYFNHFNTWEGPVAEGTLAGWVLAGAAGAATITYVTNSVGGKIALTTEATANGDANLQLTSMPLNYVVGKRMVVFARLALSDADDQLVAFGLATIDTDFFNTLPTDGIFFTKAETDTDYTLQVRKDGTSTSVVNFSGQTLANATFHTIGFAVEVDGTITPYFSLDNEYFIAGTSVAASNANVPDAAADLMVPTVVCETGNGEADTVTLDWMMVVAEM